MTAAATLLEVPMPRRTRAFVLQDSPRIRAGVVRQAVSQWKVRHPILREHVTESVVRSVLDREGYELMPRYLSNLILARSMRFMGGTFIVLDERLTGLPWVLCVLHEVGRLTMHYDDAALNAALDAEYGNPWFERDGKWYRRWPDGPLFRRTVGEAEYFARLLLGEQFRAAKAELRAFERSVLKASRHSNSE
jgi:hypothetical protein